MNQAVKDLEAIQDTVISDGWKLLMKDVEGKLEAIKEALLSPEVPVETARVAQGRVIVYKELLALPQVVEHALVLAQEDEENSDGETITL